MNAASLWLALEIVTAVRVRDPRPSGEGALVRTTGWTLVRRDGDALTLRPCGVSTEPVLGARTSYPPGFIAAVPSSEVTASFAPDRFVAGPWTTEFGEGDADADGNPGVTVNIAHTLLGRGDVYVSQRSKTLLEGRIFADGAISGRAVVEADQTVHGASRWWLRLSTNPKPDHDNSTFRMLPITDASCEAVARALGG